MDLLTALKKEGFAGLVKDVQSATCVGKETVDGREAPIGFAPGLKQRLEKELDTLLEGGRLAEVRGDSEWNIF